MKGATLTTFLNVGTSEACRLGYAHVDVATSCGPAGMYVGRLFQHQDSTRVQGTPGHSMYVGLSFYRALMLHAWLGLPVIRSPNPCYLPIHGREVFEHCGALACKMETMHPSVENNCHLFYWRNKKITAIYLPVHSSTAWQPSCLGAPLQFANN